MRQLAHGAGRSIQHVDGPAFPPRRCRRTRSVCRLATMWGRTSRRRIRAAREVRSLASPRCRRWPPRRSRRDPSRNAGTRSTVRPARPRPRTTRRPGQTATLFRTPRRRRQAPVTPTNGGVVDAAGCVRGCIAQRGDRHDRRSPGRPRRRRRPPSAGRRRDAAGAAPAAAMRRGLVRSCSSPCRRSPLAQPWGPPASRSAARPCVASARTVDGRMPMIRAASSDP